MYTKTVLLHADFCSRESDRCS